MTVPRAVLLYCVVFISWNVLVASGKKYWQLVGNVLIYAPVHLLLLSLFPFSPDLNGNLFIDNEYCLFFHVE